MVVVGAKGKSWMVVGSVADPNLGSNHMQLCFCLYFCVHFLTRPLNRIDNDNVRNEPHTRARRPAEFKRGMHQTNNDILWFGNERRVITYLLVLMHANTQINFAINASKNIVAGRLPLRY